MRPWLLLPLTLAGLATAQTPATTGDTITVTATGTPPSPTVPSPTGAGGGSFVSILTTTATVTMSWATRPTGTITVTGTSPTVVPTAAANRLQGPAVGLAVVGALGMALL